MFMFPSSYRHENSTSTPTPTPTPTPTLKGSVPFIIATALFIPFMLYFGKVVIDNNLYASIQYNECGHLTWRASVEIDRLERAHPELENRVSKALEDAKKICKDNNGAIP